MFDILWASIFSHLSFSLPLSTWVWNTIYHLSSDKFPFLMFSYGESVIQRSAHRNWNAAFFQFSVKNSLCCYFFFNLQKFHHSAKWHYKKILQQSKIKYLSSFWSSLIGFNVKSSSIANKKVEMGKKFSVFF